MSRHVFAGADDTTVAYGYDILPEPGYYIEVHHNKRKPGTYSRLKKDLDTRLGMGYCHCSRSMVVEELIKQAAIALKQGTITQQEFIIIGWHIANIVVDLPV